MPIDRDILSKVKRLTAEKSDAMTADQLFTSNQFLSYAQSAINSVTGRYKTKVKLQAYHGELDGDTAATDKRTIYLNTHHQRTYFFDSLLNKFMSQMGGIFHECAHILYMNFDIWKKQLESMESGTFLDFPTAASKEEEEGLDALAEALRDESYRPMLMNVYHSVYNSLQDGHDEDEMIAEAVPFVGQCILMRREAKQAEFPSVEELVEKQRDCELSVMFSLLLEASLFEDIYMEDPNTAMLLEPMQKLTAMMPAIQEGKLTDDAHQRGEQTVRVMAFLWPYIQKELENQTPQSSGAGQADPNAVQAVQALLAQCAQMGATQVPQNVKTSAVAKANQKAAKPGGSTASAPMSGPQAEDEEDAAQNALNNLINSIAKAEAEKEAQRDITSDAKAIVLTVNQSSTHCGIPIHFRSQNNVTDADKICYEDMMRDLTVFSRRLQKQMRDAFRDLQEGSTTRHRSYGNRFEARDAYRPDQRYFTQKRLPKEIPEMAISILVDHSGSMCGARLSSAMRASMLLYDFATKLDIPVEVAGHNTVSSGSGVNYFLYTDFRQVSPDEKYRLAKMASGNCNRDGAAIEIAANRLARRPEAIRLMIVISDGQPNDTGYGGEEAAKDISGIVKRYKKQGVETIAAAIGDDKERIKSIYGDGAFLDIDDLSRFPKALVGLVRKRLLLSA